MSLKRLNIKLSFFFFFEKKKKKNCKKKKNKNQWNEDFQNVSSYSKKEKLDHLSNFFISVNFSSYHRARRLD